MCDACEVAGGVNLTSYQFSNQVSNPGDKAAFWN